MTTEPNPLDDLQSMVERIRVMQSHVPFLVMQARLAGDSWAEIGRALGVSKQAAQKKYAVLEGDPFYEA